jgi:hypothetical protein
MNKRVLELVRDTREETKEGKWHAPTHICVEKFAELIVRECIEIVDKVYHEQTGKGKKLGRRDTPYQEIINEIEEHFGVEE